MTYEVKESIDEERLKQGEKLYHTLNHLSSEEKNAVIGYRCVKKDIPDEIDDDLKIVEFENTLDILSEIGVCFISEEDFRTIIDELNAEIPDVLDDHRSWSVLTVLEMKRYKEGANCHLEAKIYDDDECLNEIPIDLAIGGGDGVELITCKFNITTQKESAKGKSEYLHEIADKFDVDVTIGLGTLSIQIRDRIEGEMTDYFDEIITGRDILEFD